MTLHRPPLAGESWHVRPGGPRLFLRAWRPAGPVRAALVISHGVKSHGGQYEAPARSFAAAGLAVHAADLRGRGRSDGARFRVAGIADYVADLAVAVEAARARDPGLPVFLLGHSAGGVVTATYALEHPGRRAGLISENSAFRIPAPKPVPGLVKRLARAVPGLPVIRLKLRDFTRDPEVLARFEADPLIRGAVQPAATVAAMLRGSERLERSMAAGSACRSWSCTARPTARPWPRAAATSPRGRGRRTRRSGSIPAMSTTCAPMPAATRCSATCWPGSRRGWIRRVSAPAPRRENALI